MSAVGDTLVAKYRECVKTKCHKSGGTVKSGLHLRGMSGCTDLCWVSALEAGINALNAGKNRCKTAKDPIMCKARFDSLIARYRKNQAKFKTKGKAKLDRYKERLAAKAAKKANK